MSQERLSSQIIGQIAISILFVTLVGMGFTLLTPILSTKIEAALAGTLILPIPFLGIQIDLTDARSTVLGVNLALGGIANLVAIPLVPRFVARFGAKSAAAFCSLGMSACMVGFSMSDFWAWFPLRFAFHSLSLSALEGP
ncbi:hypothetical protein [Dongia sp.]|uniref:hypothetical protein n=1 Tax=Dongia sp. TaxID=1977262 RepID=UPI0035AEF573